ncbi:50S ribosomal protein L18 [Candidatus Pacearchaeota archaeon]|nr:50S ribosomal protein L18 [Candidatus Pacearchaeota archaeon]MBD3282793.1 50S ribosomal protein L18 [Candidatus Pacearchaeota archaeon]
MKNRKIKLDKRRRRENITDYKRRLILLKSRTTRLVVRKTNRYIILQLIESKNAQDRVVYSANTKELLKYGWPKDKIGSLKSLAAAYLGGFLIGKKSEKLKNKVILDMGLIPNTKGSRVYAAVKGFSDSGRKIDYNKKVVPGEERFKTEEYAKIKESIDKNGR